MVRNDAEEETVETKAKLDADDPEKDASKLAGKGDASDETVVKPHLVVEGKEKELTLQPKVV